MENQAQLFTLKLDRANSIQTRVLRYLEEPYRKFIQDESKSILEHQHKSKPKWKKVSLKDPLALHPDSEEVKGIGLAVNYPVDDLIMDGRNEFLDEEIIVLKLVCLQS